MKTLPLEEAKKQATNGPFEMRMGMSGHACVYVQGTTFDVAIGMRPDNAALFVHSMNIRDELIEALERAIELARMNDDEYASRPEQDPTKSLDAVLMRAKSVEMP